MTPNEYQQAALRTCDMLGDNAPVIKLIQELMPGISPSVLREFHFFGRHFLQLCNGMLGLNGESGECIDILKKHVFQGHELDKAHMAEELGDVAWYLATSADAIGYSLEEIFAMNIKKLQNRYPDGFDSERSIHRNAD